MKKLNNRGFSALEVILLLVLVGIIGGTAWYVLQNKPKDQSTSTTNASTTPTVQAETISADSGNIKLTLPTTWKVYDHPTFATPGVCTTKASGPDGYCYIADLVGPKTTSARDYRGSVTVAIYKSALTPENWYKTTGLTNPQGVTTTNGTKTIYKVETPNDLAYTDYVVADGGYIVCISAYQKIADTQEKLNTADVTKLVDSIQVK